MTFKTRSKIGFIFLVIALAAAVAAALPATAKTAEPTLNTLAWYWEEAQSQEFKDPSGRTITVETPNPFCPGAGQGLGQPAQSCAAGRLPVEIHQGDYKTPNKVPAVQFDLTIVPVGSTVHKFTVTFREAQAGCYETDGKPDDDPQDNQCEQTDPVNVGDHKLQACMVGGFFGDGEARPYNETPNYGCEKGDPTATRKRLPKLKDGEGSEFYWTFDLTKFAKEWTESFSTSGIVITGLPLNKEDTQSWRVVLAGPRFNNGFTSTIKFDEPELPPIAPPGTSVPPGTTTTTGTGSFPSGSTGSFGTGSTGGDLGTGTGGTGAAPAPAPTQAAEAPGEPAAAVERFPGYAWLAILAGLVGFSLVRSVVLESAAGIRPNGVLATIHRMNAERTGGTGAVAQAGSGNSLVEAMKSIGGKTKAAVGKLNFRRG